jgi:hypothetical protein
VFSRPPLPPAFDDLWGEVHAALGALAPDLDAAGVLATRALLAVGFFDAEPNGLAITIIGNETSHMNAKHKNQKHYYEEESCGEYGA